MFCGPLLMMTTYVAQSVSEVNKVERQVFYLPCCNLFFLYFILRNCVFILKRIKIILVYTLNKIKKLL